MDHDRAPVVGVRVNVLLARYLIEPCGSGKSKLTYMCRADLRYVLMLIFFFFDIMSEGHKVDSDFLSECPPPKKNGLNENLSISTTSQEHGNTPRPLVAVDVTGQKTAWQDLIC